MKLAARLLGACVRSYDEARQAMVDLLRARGVTDPRVLTAMARVPRHNFVPAHARGQAYGDHPLAIGEGQTISQPYVVALMSERLRLTGREKVLEVGTGSGYQAAILAELAGEVYSIEIVPELARRSSRALDEAGYPLVQTRTADGYLGWPEAAPFEAIIVTAAPDHVPEPLTAQLAEGGRMIIPVGPAGGGQALRLIEKRAGKLEKRELEPVRFVPLVREREN